jgi:hypothetical protein
MAPGRRYGGGARPGDLPHYDVTKWVRVEKRKYPRQTHLSWEAIELEVDEHGTWFLAPKGVGNSHSASGVQLLPAGRWWVAWWWADANRWWCAADVATPPCKSHDAWSYDDLEIDVWGDEGGFRGVADEEEFEQVRSALPYPDEIAKSALASRDEIVTLMNDRAEPFGTLGWDKLRSALEAFGGSPG